MTVALWILAGFGLLIVGGELLVRGSVRAAECFGVSPLLIGLTLVGFGTSTPELVTSVQAALLGSPGIAVGNIVGSNLANMLLILGLSALVLPLAVSGRSLKRDGGVMLAVTVLFVAVGLTTGLNRVVGAVFAALLVGYMIYAYRQESARAEDHTAAFERAEAVENFDLALRPGGERRPGVLAWLRPVGVAIVGLALIVVGARVLVGGAVDLARVAGLSEEVIGLTIVAIGTSAPELVTSLVAAMRKQADIAIGNVFGSNLYNLLGIGSVTALIAPTAVPAQIARVDAPFMLAVTVLLMWFAWTSKRLSRTEGAVFLVFYVSYIGYLIAA